MATSTKETQTTLLDLPVDLLVLIFPYLDVASFLNFTTTCKALHQPSFVHDSTYWSARVRGDFRIPNQPVVQTDGRRWQRLYKRLRTQSKIFTWGNNDKGCLGQAMDTQIARRGPGHFPRRPHMRRGRHVSWPGKMQGVEELGIISDLQQGGWSTTLLNSKGELYSVGVLDGLGFVPGRAPYVQHEHSSPTPLHFPPGLPHPRDRYDPATAIRQFSAGRTHVLALSDSGRIWSWQNIDHPGVNVKFLHHTVNENGRSNGSGVVRKVVAGWQKSAALIEGTGIVVWEPLQLDPHNINVTDAALVLESAVVPRSSSVEPKQSGRQVGDGADTEAQDIGEVSNMAVLSDVVLFCTSSGRAFASLITWTDTVQALGDPVELSLPAADSSTADATTVTDIQGAYQKFAVFTKSGAVLTSTQDRLMPLLQNPHRPQRIFQRIPALQNKQVISLAFGDYHFHALHAPGYITSYGYEPQGCGALGLGGHGVPEGRLRGIRNQGIGGDGRLVPHAYMEGRRVWFEADKREWITFLTSGGADQREAAERLRMAIGSPDINAQGEVSEWIEQEGRDWESKYGVDLDKDDDGLGAYFALSVSAAGWHSGALVLVNEQKAHRLHEAVIKPDEPEEQITANTEAAHAEQPVRLEAEPEAGPSTTNDDMTFWDRAADLGRYFLGMAPYNVHSAAYDPNAQHLRQNDHSTSTAADRPHRNPQPLNYGASPGEGLRYVWADDHFPRLRLSDGTEMPGDVEFDRWRYGRPEWKLGWESEGLGREDE